MFPANDKFCRRIIIFLTKTREMIMMKEAVGLIFEEEEVMSY
jgi:hypothetical protein